MYSVFQRLLEEKGCSVADVSRATGIGESTLSNWKKRGGNLSTQNLQKLADFFDVSIECFFGKESPSGERYYFDDDTASVAQELFQNPDLRMLFSAAMDAKPEDLKMAADMLKRFKETNPDG